MARGGAGPYRKGAAFERKVQKHYEAHGWLCVRQPKSQSPFDLLATNKTVRHLIQCKLAGGISKKDKQDLLELCEKHYYTAILAFKLDGQIVLHYLENGSPADVAKFVKL